jgi:hypothetical protein
MDSDQHFSADRIRLLAEGQLLMGPCDLQHIQSCGQCSDAWWRCYIEARRRESEEAEKQIA